MFGASATRELLTTSTDNAMEHIALARWADVVLIAPASAPIFSPGWQYGRADDLLAVCVWPPPDRWRWRRP